MQLSMKSFHGSSGLSSLQPIWMRLLEQMPTFEFFHHPEWHKALQNWLLRDQLSYVLIENEGEPLAIIPVSIKKTVALAQAGRTVNSPQHEHIVLSDWVLCANVDLKCTANIISQIMHTLNVGNWSRFILRSLPHSSAACLLHERLHDPSDGHSGNFLSTLEVAKYSAWFDCGKNAHPVAGKLRRNLRRLKAQAEKTAKVEMLTAADPADLPDAFQKFLDIEASGWKGGSGKGTAIKQDVDLVGFYKSIVEAKVSGLTAKINFLRMGSDVVAAQYILVTPSCTSVLKTAYDEDFQKYAPGSLLLYETIKANCEDSSTKKLSLVTCPEWVDRWHPNKSPVYNCIIYNNTARGKAIRGIDSLKALARLTYNGFMHN